MKILTNIIDLNKAIRKVSNLGFVPTMGGLHKGHKSLIIESVKRCKKTIVSIFVNPTQFNEKKDFKSYPRNLNKDLKILKGLNIDYVFIPYVSEIYKKKRGKKIKLNKHQKVLCAKYRKGHFEGVLDVMDRLLKIIKAKYIFMGEKDYQQIILIKKFIKNKYKSKVVSCPTIRDKNKVALSTRNFLLTKKNLFKVGLISKYLINHKFLISKNTKLLMKSKEYLEKKFKIKIQYLESRDPNNLQISNYKKKNKLFIAYYINNIRLIDNY
tara:strand:- start:2317 stop:3120 length:804 start_codon:yes stop_codon:yes gene_type:complete